MNLRLDGKRIWGLDEGIGFAAWLSLALTPAAMIVGHLGEHGLSWKTNHISTFAARATYDDWITASILLAALALLCIGTIVSSSRWPGGQIPSSLIAMTMGASVAGLLLLAAFEEEAVGLTALRNSGFDAVRRQSFHDAGLLVFFHGAVLALFASGAAMLAERGVRTRIFGAAVAASGPLAYAAMVTSWPVLLGVAGAGVGLKQRLSFLFLWTGAVLLLAAVTRRHSRTP